MTFSLKRPVFFLIVCFKFLGSCEVPQILLEDVFLCSSFQRFYKYQSQPCIFLVPKMPLLHPKNQEFPNRDCYPEKWHSISKHLVGARLSYISIATKDGTLKASHAKARHGQVLFLFWFWIEHRSTSWISDKVLPSCWYLKVLPLIMDSWIGTMAKRILELLVLAMTFLNDDWVQGSF